MGALGGVSATGPMTIGMVWLHRRLLQNTVIPSPPREITMKLMESLGIDKKLGRDARAALTLREPLRVWGGSGNSLFTCRTACSREFAR